MAAKHRRRSGYFGYAAAGLAVVAALVIQVIVGGTGGLPGAEAVVPSTVTFDKNAVDASGTMAAQTSSTTTALTSNGFTKVCNNFASWNTVSNGSGTTYANGATYSFTSSITLYAQWTSSGNVIVFNANGGSGSMAPQCSFTAVNISSNTLTPSAGYVFNGWNTAANGSGTAYADGASFPFSAVATTLYAQWTPAPNRTVTFDTNGGSGSMSPQTANLTTALSTNTFTRTGYGFASWNTAANGTGTTYAAGATYSFSADVTLYAQWTLNTYTITFNKNNGSGSMSNQTYTHGVAANLASSTYTRTNYLFTGWNTAVDGSGTAYQSGSSYTFTASTTLYAQWTNQISISFDANGGSGSMAAQTFTINTSGTLNANTFTRDGYIFYGWNTAANGTGTAYYDSGSATFASATTIYAKWVAVPVGSAGVIFNANGGSGTMSAQVASSPTALNANGFTAPASSGKTFQGWNTASNGSGTAYGPGATYPFSSNTTLFAQWGFALTFNKNAADATGTMADQVGFVTSTAINANAFSRTGYVFVGWTTSNSAVTGTLSTIYANQASITLTAARTLYSQWAPGSPGQYAVMFLGNGGAAADTSTVFYQAASTSTALTSNPFIRAGYTFLGWTDVSGGTTAIYADGTSYAFTASKTLWAVWKQNTVTYNANGGTSAPTAQTGTSDAQLSTYTQSRTGYVFSGWNTAADGSGVGYGQNATFPLGGSNTSTTLYAQWLVVPTGSKYVMYVGNNATSGTMLPQIAATTTALTSNAFTRSQYVFGGWNTKSDGTGTSYADGVSYSFSASITLYAQWQPIVTYNPNYVGGGATVTQAAPTSWTLLPLMYSRSGYVFKGWNTATDGSGTWYRNGESGISNTSSRGITSPTTIYAQWVSVAAGEHVVIFWTSSPTTQKASVPTALTVAAGTTKKTFLGWATSPTGAIAYTDKATYPFDADITLFPIYGPNIVTFDANGGRGTMSTQTATSSTNLTIGAFARTGFTFIGWNTKADGTGTTYADQGSYPFGSANTSATLYAQWTPSGYLVSYNANGGTGSMASQSVTSPNSLVLAPNVFSKVGKIFTGWSTNAAGTGTSYLDGATVTPTANLTLYAQWVARAPHQISFDANGGTGSMDPITNTTGSLVLPGNTFVKDNAIFYGWNTAADGSGTGYADQSLAVVNSDLLLYAQYITFTSGQVAISFSPNGGTGSSITPLVGTPTFTTTAPANPFAYPSFVFAGWNTRSDGAGTMYAPGSTLTFPSESTTLYAIWTPTWFTVTFVTNGGTGTMDSQVGNEASNLNANTFTRTNWVFSGWNTAANGTGTAYLNSASFNFQSSITLYAQWTQTAFTVTYNANGGVGSMADQTSATASTPLQPNVFTRDGYVFSRWDTSASGTGTSYANGANYGFAADLTLYAVWTPLFTVTFDPNGGSGSMSNQTANVSTPLTVTTFTKSAYSFSGWNTAANGSGTRYLDGAAYPFTSSVTLYAQWTLITYPVVFDGNGGSGSMSTIRGVGVTTLPANTFTRSGYTYKGWALTPEVLSATYSNTGSVNVTAPMTLYAVWSPDQHTITYASQGGSSVPSDTFVTDATITLPAAPTRAGYTFNGWFVASSGGTTVGATYTPPLPVDVTLYAQWTVNTYNVTYDDNGATTAHVGGAATYTTGSAFSLPTVPSRSGYTFAGWRLTGSNATTATLAASATSATPAGYGDVTLTAQWTVNTYNVTYDDNGATTAHDGGDATYETGSPFALPTAPSRSGYTFIGWRMTGGHVTATNVVPLATTATPSGYDDVTMTARWAAVTNTVTYDDNGATSAHAGGDGAYDTGSAFMLPTAPTRSGYTFAGWRMTGAHITSASVPSNAATASPSGYDDVTLTAQWSPLTYSVTYADNGATSAHSGGDTTYDTGSPFSLPTPPTRSGYTFAGWRVTGTHVTTATTSASATDATPAGYGNILLTAQWIADVNNVTYDDNGATTAHSGGDATYSTGSPFTLATPPVREGYNFNGWVLTGVHVVSANLSASLTSATPSGYDDVTLTARWTALSYAVSYDDNGATTAHTGGASSYLTGTAFELPTPPARSGYSFAGWSLEGNHVTAETVDATATEETPLGYDDVTLTATWSAIVNNVTYDDNGATTAHSGGDSTYSTGAAFTLPTHPVREGYAFAGWRMTGPHVTTTSVPLHATSELPIGYGDVTLMARWSASAYVVTYDPQGGTDVDPGGFNWGDDVTLPSGPTRSGYTFSGWFVATSGGSALGTSYSPFSPQDVTLYAHWTPRSYVVTYDPQGGSDVDPGSYTWGGDVTLPSGPTRAGYTFAGWFIAASGGSALGAAFTPGSPANLTIYAQWTPVVYSITYVDNDATTNHVGGDASYATGSSFLLPTAPRRTGYSFDGWEVSGMRQLTFAPTALILIAPIEISYAPSGYGDLTLTAQWTPLSYVVTYNSTGGSSVAPGSYVWGGRVTLPPAPSRLGYTFTGWFLSPTGGTPLLGSHQPTSPGALTIYAHWTPIEFTLTYESNGGVGQIDPATFSLETSQISVATGSPLSRQGYTFAGWNTAPDGSGSNYGIGSLIGLTTNLTLYAMWNLIPVPPVTTPSPPSPTPSPTPTNVRNLGLPLATPMTSPGLPGRTPTLDLGDGIQSASAAGDPLQSLLRSDAAKRTVGELGSEELGGFSSGQSVQILISGSRTTGQFLMSDSKVIDVPAIAAALSESMPRTGTDFARLTQAHSVSQVDLTKVTTGQVTKDAADLFTASGLGTPRTLGDLPITTSTHWLNVSAQVNGYVPGTVVYLAVTTDPIIFGSALVGADGNVSLDGYLPVDALEAGAHRLRIIGTRDLGGATVDASGNVHVSDAVMASIRKFDNGTNAVVQMNGGSHAVFRLVPLYEEAPWWLFWFYLAALALAFALRRWKVRLRWPVVTIWTVGIGGFIGVETAAWLSFSFEMMLWTPAVTIVGLGLELLLSLVRRGVILGKKSSEAEQTSVGMAPVQRFRTSP